MRIKLNNSCPFNLHATLCCGQAFRWNRLSEWWYGVVGEKVFKIRQIGKELEFENVNASFVENYFGLCDDLPKILSKISKDKHIKRAINASTGLRILRQKPCECLISYICATYKNVKAIKQMLDNLSKKFGEKSRFDDYDFYTFPTPEKLAKATITELAECGLGYRAVYMSETSKIVYENNFDFDSLRSMPYEEAREKLLEFSGVGLKVADCVLLFSLGKLEAFPVDVWIRRVLLRHYANHFPRGFVEKISVRKSFTNSDYGKLNSFGQKYFGEYAGYAQEYLYHYERTNAR